MKKHFKRVHPGESIPGQDKEKSSISPDLVFVNSNQLDECSEERVRGAFFSCSCGPEGERRAFQSLQEVRDHVYTRHKTSVGRNTDQFVLKVSEEHQEKVKGAAL